MRFALHSPQVVGAIKIDWAAPVELTSAIREAMAPHDVDEMHVGAVMRGFVIGNVTYPHGTIAFQVAEGHELFLQLPSGAEPAPRAARAPTEVVLVGVIAGDTRYQIRVGDAFAGVRLDAVLASVIPELSRTAAQRLIDEGHVTLGGRLVAKSKQRPRTGDVIELVVPNAVVS